MPSKPKRKATASAVPEVKERLLEVRGIEPEQFTKIGALVWGMTGASIGGVLILLSILLPVMSFIPGMPAISFSFELLFYSVIITFVLTIFYGMIGGLMANLASHSINAILERVGGIHLKVRLV